MVKSEGFWSQMDKVVSALSVQGSPSPPALAASRRVGGAGVEGILFPGAPAIGESAQSWVCEVEPSWFPERPEAVSTVLSCPGVFSVCETGARRPQVVLENQHNSKSSCCPSALAHDVMPVSSPLSLHMTREPGEELYAVGGFA